jgi:hypothetical protein
VIPTPPNKRLNAECVEVRAPSRIRVNRGHGDS